MNILPVLDLTAPGVVLGNHGVWLPEHGIKVPFQWSGCAVKRTHRHEEATPIWESLADELGIMQALAELGMAPPIGEVVYFERVLHGAPWHEDPVGAFGYEMADATKLPPGRFSLDAMKRLPIEGSPGAWGDVGKPDNAVNGYLVDVRRSAWDRLRWRGTVVRPEPRMNGATDRDIAAQVHRDGQFPAGERELAYQDFWIDASWIGGQRRVRDRCIALGFTPRRGETVLDLGCQIGSFLQWAALTAYIGGGEGGKLVGLDVHEPYLDCARLLARRNGHNICYRNLDARRALQWIREYFPSGPDHLLCLSLEKHIGEPELFRMIDAIGARHTYIETNADRGAPGTPGKLWSYVKPRGGRYLGDSTDRNLRRLYRLDKE